MDKLIVSPSPHLHTKTSTKSLMRDVVIALLPAVVVSVLFYGWSELLVLGVSVASCVLLEFLITKYLLKGTNTIGDWSAVITGVLLALNLTGLGNGATVQQELFRQGGLTPHIEFKEDTYTLDGNSVENSLAINSNLSVYEAPQIKYSVNGNWINDYRLSPNGVELKIFHAANSGAAAREAMAEISFTDCWGETFKDTAKIVQSVKQASPEVSE